MNSFNEINSKLIFIPLFLASIVATVYLLQIVFAFLGQFSWLLIVLVYAYIIYILVAPLDKLLRKASVPSQISLYLSFIIIFSVFTLIIFFLNPIIADELKELAIRLKDIGNNTSFNESIQRIANIFNLNPEVLKQNITESVNNFGISLANNVINILSNALVTFVQLVLALIFGYFFIKDGSKWFKGFLKVIPRKFRSEVLTISNDFNKSASSFIQIQVLMAFVYSIINYIVMTIFGIDFALTASIIAFLTFIIPGIGPLISLFAPFGLGILFAMNKVLWVILILLLVQQVILNVIIPRVYGDKVGVHPMVILLSILVGVQLFGVLGAFIVIPLITVMVNVAEIYFKKLSASQTKVA